MKEEVVEKLIKTLSKKFKRAELNLIFSGAIELIKKKKNLYENHPQTDSKIKGFKFPDWDKAISMCKEASKVVPQMGYIGWDVCFTPNGPIFVEGNEFPGHDIYQLPEHTPNKIGMMPKFNI